MSAVPHLTSFARRTPYAYRLWNHRVESDFDLGALDPDNGPASESNLEVVPAVIRLLRATGSAWPRPEKGVLEHRLEDGDIWQESWEALGGYVSRFPGLCSFRIFPGILRIECAAEPHIDAATLAHFALDHAIPRLLSLRPGCVVLHAGAIQMNGGVVAVLGESGQGKSTLAAWLSAQGHPVLTDDCLLLEWNRRSREWNAVPSYRSVRLWPDSLQAIGIADHATHDFAGYCSKRRTGAEANLNFAAASARVTDCFVLTDPAESGPPVVRPLGVNEAFLSLAESVFRLAVMDPEMNRREFEALTELAATVRFWSLSYQREYSALPAVEQAITKTIQAEPHEPAKRKLT